MPTFIRPPCDEPLVRSPRPPPLLQGGRTLGARRDNRGIEHGFHRWHGRERRVALQRGLNANVVDAQWVIEAYSLLLAAFLLVGGR
jgi:hypothetical protein